MVRSKVEGSYNRKEARRNDNQKARRGSRGEEAGKEQEKKAARPASKDPKRNHRRTSAGAETSRPTLETSPPGSDTSQPLPGQAHPPPTLRLHCGYTNITLRPTTQPWHQLRESEPAATTKSHRQEAASATRQEAQEGGAHSQGGDEDGRGAPGQVRAEQPRSLDQTQSSKANGSQQATHNSQEGGTHSCQAHAQQTNVPRASRLSPRQRQTALASHSARHPLGQRADTLVAKPEKSCGVCKEDHPAAESY